MSYILDALKKSDQERKQGEIPSLQTVHSDQISRRRAYSAKRRKIALMLLSCCLVATAVGLWIWQSGALSPESDHPAAKNATVSGQATSPVPSPNNPIASQMTAPAPQSQPQIVEPASRNDSPEHQDSADTPVIQQPEVVIEPAPLTHPNQIPGPQLPQAAREPGSTLPLLKNLPVDQQRIIPEISLAGHVYSDEPSRRMIMINSRIVREGELVGENLRLVKITWDGVILRHINTEFQIKLQ
jgi:general secretion pathway protein B